MEIHGNSNNKLNNKHAGAVKKSTTKTKSITKIDIKYVCKGKCETSEKVFKNYVRCYESWQAEKMCFTFYFHCNSILDQKKSKKKKRSPGIYQESIIKQRMTGFTGVKFTVLTEKK